MTKLLKIGFAVATLLTIIVGCSTEKNSVVNRTYHSVNARFNGYFNATELINQSVSSYRASRAEDYYQLLPIDPVPNEEEVIGMYPAIDTAIVKCKKVIRDHSMPSNDRPSRKKDEHNTWIDENWTMIGIASYYRRDYEGAMKSFKFVRKFYNDDPSLYVGELWMAKTNMAEGKYTEARFNLDNLDRAITEQEDKKANKSLDKEDRPAKFPKSIRFDLEKTKAELALQEGDKLGAINFLEESLKHTTFADRNKRGRVHFILGQLHEEQGNDAMARDHYSKVTKSNVPFEMAFNAELKEAFFGDEEKVKKELNKMLKDAKNAEFKGQIYYALADIELNEGNEEQGIVYLTQSAFYSENDPFQRGKSYERLGDMSFAKRNYVPAQKYYDSCALAITDDYPNAEVIRNKALRLADLVVAVETAVYEDSVQRIAAMNESDRNKFLKNLVKKIEKEEQERKEREAMRLLELQENENLFTENASGSKWYWNNAKTRSEGALEFKRLWGQRENEDNWRRSEKEVVLSFDPEGDNEFNDSTDVVEEPEEDTLSVESLALNLPLTDSSLAVSNERLLEAYYDAGVIYKEQLNEPLMAEKQFVSVLDRKVENEHNLLSAYQLYGLKKDVDQVKANYYRDYIYNNYPNSDYANFLRDPNYFVKKKERDALAEQEYVKVLDRYDRGIYSPVMSKADQVINEEKDNVFRAKYMLLKAMCLGQTRRKKDDLIPVLEMLVAEYPGTPEEGRAKEMLDIIKNGYSKNIEADFSSKSPFKYEDKVKLMVVIFLDKEVSSASAKSRISDFNREFFSRDRLKIKSLAYGEGSVVIVDEFETESDAGAYIRAYKKTRKYLLDLQNANILMITNDNLKVLVQKQNLKEYQDFYDEYY
ncbi:MAG: hypothetical protein MK066_08345 [Crocinitomicaceae bacterium]|nr:hypothetical protein [Crocinitomicaceae bacterium]